MFRRRLNRHTNRRGGTDPASSIVRRGATDDQQREAVERIAKTQDSLRAVLRRCRGSRPLARVGRTGGPRVPEPGGQATADREPAPPLPASRGREVGTEWAGFHTFRHTYASLKLAGRTKRADVVEVSKLLGHSAIRVTLDTYAHWIDRDRAEALDLDRELAGGGLERIASEVLARTGVEA
jgi:integrase